ncbi:XrtA/PEP-CTERM system amidotransferase [Thioalkalivibrio halophilus]|uniref:asparagine synthase (glutamine-hydrolyzing) n=1 Tax=Thioalkalivibrio halophilus TaxID=252474 RepID=A0A1V3A231_9GAMM|nr:XrtA/PEP-CTERM system amidotransferase [Thioalkalivibrio halophilus]OOC11437.1 asparagine synthetase B [Thioalkalivibrio halophilus]
MCGLVGILAAQADVTPGHALLERMNVVQFHRGPDDDGQHQEPGIALGHRRLAIIDLAGGRQPLANADGSVLTVYNGEIYNFPELMRELQACGHHFRTHCDTEVIVHAWEEWGEACVEHFRGMFAFAIWDRKRQTLFLARDRLGIKPLHYARLPDGRWLFASEIKSLLTCPELPRDLDPKAVEEYFAYGYVPDPRSIFAAIRKLPPGHTLSLQPGTEDARPRPYWDLQFAASSPASTQAAQDELRARLHEAVDIRMVSEVPLGAFLSGGVDSSAVVATMSQLSEDPVNACSIGFGDPRFNESDHARAVAGRVGARHFLDQVDVDRMQLIDPLAQLYDEPFADSSALPTYELSRLTRQHVTVALSGDGGDETLTGYRRYRGFRQEERLRGLLPGGLRRPLFGTLAALYPKADWAPRAFRAKATFQALARDAVEGYLRSVTVVDDASRARLFSPRFRRELQGYAASEVLHAHAARAPREEPLDFVQYLDLKTWLPGDILTKVDRASMAHGLEVRVPILDHPFVEWAATLPANLRLHQGEGKYLLKRAFEQDLPHDVLYRRKQGFVMPIADWFRGPLRDTLRQAVLGERLADSGWFNPERLRQLVDEHQSGRSDHSRPLWALLMFESFLRQRVDVPAERIA